MFPIGRNISHVCPHVNVTDYFILTHYLWIFFVQNTLCTHPDKRSILVIMVWYRSNPMTSGTTLLTEVKFIFQTSRITRMHSSRMRTGRSLTVCWRLLPGGEGGLVLGGICSRGCLVLAGCLLRGGGGISACTEADTFPLCGQNHRRL